VLIAVGKYQVSFEGKDSAKAAFCWVNVLFKYFWAKGYSFFSLGCLF
jgi:hypothetical protein